MDPPVLLDGDDPQPFENRSQFIPGRVAWAPGAGGFPAGHQELR